MEDKLNFEVSDLALDETAQYYFKNTARWAKFLAIVGFVTCAFMVLVGAGISTFMSYSMDIYKTAIPNLTQHGLV